jgi:regulator of replication initiation timing
MELRDEGSAGAPPAKASAESTAEDEGGFGLKGRMQEFDFGVEVGEARGSGLELASLAPSAAPPPAAPAPTASSPTSTGQTAAEAVRRSAPEAAPNVAVISDHPPVRDSISAGLRLVSLAPPPELKGKIIEETPRKDLEVKKVAGFGKPDHGAIGAIRYWLRVRERLAVLGDDTKLAVQDHKEAMEYRRMVGSELGREGQAAGLAEKPLAPRYAKAAVADNALRDMQGRKSGLVSERQATLNRILSERKKLEKEAAPLRRMEERATRKLNKMKGEYQKIHKQLEQLEVEYEEHSALIAKQQAAYFDQERSEQEREELFCQTGQLERKNEERIRNIGRIQARLSEMTDPITAAGVEANEIREQLSGRMVRVAKLRRAEQGLTKDYANKEGEVDLEIEEATAKVDAAWAEVGESIIKNDFGGPELATSKSKLEGAIQRTARTQQRVETLAIAKESYDFDTVARAKKITAAAGATVVLLLIVLIVSSGI